MTTWLLLAGAVISEVSATLSLKGALDHPGLYAVALAGYIVSFVLLAAVLGHGMALGVAYGIWAALGVASTVVMSALLFDEALTTPMVLGITVIIAGVLAVELGAHQAGTNPQPEEVI